MNTKVKAPNIKIKSICFFLLIVSLNACQKKYEGTTFMAFNNVHHVTSFAQEQMYKKSDAKQITASYGKNFRIIDHYLIEETGGETAFWRVTNRLTDASKAIAHKGHGEYEFMSNPRLNEANIYIENGEVRCRTNDFNSGKTFEINISRSLGNGTFMKRGPNIASSAFNALLFSDSVYMYRTISTSEEQQTRFVFKNGKPAYSPAAEALNSARIPAGEDFNILSSIMAYEKKNGLVLEAPICLNTLNIYNVDGSVKQSVCYGEQRWSIQDLLRKGRKDRCYTFENPRIYDSCCAVLWLGDSKQSYFTGKRNKPTILVFGLNGEGLAKFDFDFTITHFEFAPKEHRLYVRDEENGYIYAYDCIINQSV